MWANDFRQVYQNYSVVKEQVLLTTGARKSEYPHIKQRNQILP